ncbi:MAG: hypothetical protein KatS3mg087_1740 [Patescibacteria group bacterium]|nr:MAG: hypothetical protein KatS3mg087_1740 [Patescibacteria group bacterium]
MKLGSWIEDAAWNRLELLFRRAGIEFHRVQVDFLRRSYRYRFFGGGSSFREECSDWCVGFDSHFRVFEWGS